MFDDAVDIHNSILVFSEDGMLINDDFRGDYDKINRLGVDSLKGLIRCTRGRVRTLKKEQRKLKSLKQGLILLKNSLYIDTCISEKKYVYLIESWDFYIKRFGISIGRYNISLKVLENQLAKKGDL